MRHDGTDKAERERGAEVCARADAAHAPIVDMGAVTTRTARGTVYCLTVIGQIEGHSLLPNTVKTTKYEHVLPLLAALDESEEIDGVLLLLNTCGGDVEAGLAIAELIAGMRKPTVSLVLGGGHSIGVPLAVAPKRSLIAPSASMTVHPIRTNGTLIAAPQTYHYFDRLQERIVRFVTKNSGISEKKLLALMLAAEDMAADVGSILYGEEAVADGLIDRRRHARRRLRGALHAHRRIPCGGEAAAETRGTGKMKRKDARRASFLHSVHHSLLKNEGENGIVHKLKYVFFCLFLLPCTKEITECT